MRSWGLAVALSAACVIPAGAQTEARARATIVVPPVLRLQVLPGTGVPTTSVAGGARVEEVAGATELRVSANRRWKLMVTAAGAASEGSPDEAAASLSWRARAEAPGEVSEVVEGFRRAGPAPLEAARGRRGRDIVLLIDERRVIDPAGAAPRGVGLTYTLLPN